MKKTIRIIAMLLVLVTAFGMAPVPVSAAEPIIDEKSGWFWPTVYETINSPFGQYRSSDGKYHQGIDIKAPLNTNVYATRSGEVYKVGVGATKDSSMGNYICIRHGKNADGKYIFSTYMHLNEVHVKEGDIVNMGDVIGLSGNTGYSSGPHLHFHIFRATSMNPGSVSPNRASMTALNQNYINVNKDSISYNGSIASSLNINVPKAQAPSLIKVGKCFGMRGSVTSNYPITYLYSVIYNSEGKIVMDTVEYPYSCSVDLKTSLVNNGLTFNTLSAGGYWLDIVAIDSSGKREIWGQGFSVQYPVATFSMTQVPTDKNYVRLGKCFGLRGYLSSNFIINSVRGEIIRKSDGVRVDETWDYPAATGMDVRYANLNNYLDFNLLKAGDYTLKITVNLSCGDSLTWKQDFKVK